MKWTTVIVGGCGLLALVTMARAEPGELPPSSEAEREPVVVLDAPPRGRACSRVGTICWFADGRETVRVPSDPVAVADGGALSLVPRFERGSAVQAGATAAEGAAPAAREHASERPWVIELQAPLKRASYTGNLVFSFYDADDAEALVEHQYTALYQLSLKSTRTLAARLRLHPEEGFRAGHRYRLRVVQLVSGQEILLAEGDLTLL